MLVDTTLMTHLVDCKGNYIGIGIDIIKNKRWYNVIFITIHLFGNNIIIEPLKTMKWKHFKSKLKYILRNILLI